MPQPAAPPISWIDIFGALNGLLTWIVVIWGWKVLRRDNDAADCRRELRDKITYLSQEIRDLEYKAWSYYTSEPADPECERLAHDIKRDNDHIDMHFELLTKVDGKAFNSLRKGVDFRKALTIEYFDGADRKRLPYDHARLAIIADAAKAFIEYLENEYSRKYPGS